jgi:hypothetical protein
MSATRTITAVTTALVLSLAGCSGGDGDDRARTVTPATTAPTEEINGGGEEALTEAQLKAALLTVADLPTGYTAAADDDEDEDEDDSKTTGEDAECSERFAALDASEDQAVATADADFEGGFGVILEQDLSSFDDEDALKDSVDNVVDVLSDCPSFTDTDDEGVTTEFTIGQLSFPKLGDDTVALAVTGKSQDFDIRANLVVVRLGRNLMIVTQGGLTVDPAALEKATRTGLQKLADAGK